MTTIENAFYLACQKFGWSSEFVVKYHERDDSSWTTKVWINQYGDQLFEESKMNHHMMNELIKIALGEQ